MGDPSTIASKLPIPTPPTAPPLLPPPLICHPLSFLSHMPLFMQKPSEKNKFEAKTNCPRLRDCFCQYFGLLFNYFFLMFVQLSLCLFLWSLYQYFLFQRAGSWRDRTVSLFLFQIFTKHPNYVVILQHLFSMRNFLFPATHPF